MYNIKLLNKIAKVGTDNFDKAQYNVSADIENPDAIMVRSEKMHDYQFNPELKAIARAGAGVNNIPIDRCSENGIVVFNTPGANANGVKELAIAAMLLASRDIVGGVEWVNSQKGQKDIAAMVEKQKSKYAGIELKGKTLGVIGLGAIGGMVANVAHSLGMEVIGCDPYITIEGAWGLSRAIKKAATYDEIFAKCDYISVHVPATNETKGMFCSEAFAKMKDGVRIINLSRAELVNAADLKAAVESGKVAAYVTDFAIDELVGIDSRIITIPHLGASTSESEDNCAVMAAKELIDFLENGNIKNSVNYPNTELPSNGNTRICIMHKNVAGVISEVSAALAAEGINIDHMINRSRGDYAYTIIEIDGSANGISEKLKDLCGIIRINIFEKK